MILLVAEIKSKVISMNYLVCFILSTSTPPPLHLHISPAKYLLVSLTRFSDSVLDKYFAFERKIERWKSTLYWYF